MNSQQTVPRTRHKWFPVVVLAAAAIWWAWRASYAQYHTLFHLLVVLLSVVSIAVWFLTFGGASRRMRRLIVGGLALAMIAFLTAFRPVYNGDMGVYRWRLRFAADADQSLEPLHSAGEAADWHTTPHDYPRFLGQRLLGRSEGRRTRNRLAIASRRKSCGGAKSAPVGRRLRSRVIMR